jgi:hypothetical protein
MRRRAFALPLVLAALLVAGLALRSGTPDRALAVATVPSLGPAQSFAVLAGTTVTNTGPTVVSGDLGVSPGSAVTGFPPGVVLGTIHAADATAAQAQTELTSAYNTLAGEPCATPLIGDLGGLTLTPGVYCFAAAAGLTGTVTLDAQGNPNAGFVFQTGSALTTASGSVVNLINGAQGCNVFWQVGSSATLGTGSSFTGNLLALTSITVTTGTTVTGRALARNGAVTLDSDSLSTPACAPPAPSPATVTLTATPPTAAPGQLVTFTASVGCTSGTPSGTVTFSSNGAALATVPVSGSIASVTLPVPATGLFAVVASYNGDPFCAPGSSAAASVTSSAPIVITNPAVTLGIVTVGCGSTTPSALTAFGFLSATPVTAVPCPGSVFVGWTGGPCSGTRINPCDIAATGITRITATFTP